MVVILGPVLIREGGYAFDVWTRENGRSRGYVYRRIEDAHYARKAEILCRGNGHAGDIVACNTVDEFLRATTVLTAEDRMAVIPAAIGEVNLRTAN